MLKLRISEERENAILLRYPDIKSFLEKMILNTADKIMEITDFNETDIEEYHERQVLNKDVKWIPGQPYWKGRKHTQKTKDRISKSLKAKGFKGIKKIDTLIEFPSNIGINKI